MCERLFNSHSGALKDKDRPFLGGGLSEAGKNKP